jgi:hypothetical protein
LGCGGSSGGGFAAGDADDAKDGKFGESGTRDKNAVGGRVQIGRSDLDAVIEHGEKVVGDHTFERFSVAIAKADPEAIELGAAEEGFALGFKFMGEVANEVNRAHLVERNLLVLAVWSEQINGIGLAEARGIQIAAKGLLVGKENDDFLVSRGWGAVSQRNQFVKVRNRSNLRIIKMYVMLSGFFLSTYCFH